MTRSKPVALCLLLLFAVAHEKQLTARALSAHQDAKLVVSGTWEGTLTIGPQKLRLELKVSEESDKSLTAVMNSLDQPNGNNLKVDSITLKDGQLHFELRSYQIVYDAEFIDKGSAEGLDASCVEKIQRPPFTILK